MKKKPLKKAVAPRKPTPYAKKKVTPRPRLDESPLLNRPNTATLNLSIKIQIKHKGKIIGEVEKSSNDDILSMIPSRTYQMGVRGQRVMEEVLKQAFNNYDKKNL